VDCCTGFTLQDLEEALADKARWQETAQKSMHLVLSPCFGEVPITVVTECCCTFHVQSM
jgi:cytochrome b561